MKLVFVIDNIHSGGAQRQVAELARFLSGEPDLDVRVVIYRESDFFADRLSGAGVPIQVVPKRAGVDWRFPGELRRHFRKTRPDIVHVFLPTPVLWGHLAVRGMPEDERPIMIAAERSALDAPWLYVNLIKRFIYPRCDAISVNAEGVGREIEEKLGIASDRIHYIPNGIQLEEWDREARQEPPIRMEPDYFHLALVGGLRFEKNHKLVVEALRRIGVDRIRSWRVWFIGAETGERGFAAQIRREIDAADLGRIIQMVPATTRIAAVMRQIDGLLLPSQFEGFPNVALEAMASRVPVIASRVGDVPNMIDDGHSGFILERVGPDELAEAMLQLHDMDAATRAEMGARARQTAEERFSMAIVARRHVELYRELITEPASCRRRKR